MDSVAAQEGNVSTLATLLTNPPFATCKIGLFTNPLVPSILLGMTGLTQPTYTSYALQSVALAGPANVNADGTIEYLGSVAVFRGTVPGDFPVTLQGYLICDSSGTSLLAAAVFDVPIVLHGITESVALVGRLRLEIDGDIKGSADIIP